MMPMIIIRFGKWLILCEFRAPTSLLRRLHALIRPTMIAIVTNRDMVLREINQDEAKMFIFMR